jgi:hypothetical protein
MRIWRSLDLFDGDVGLNPFINLSIDLNLVCVPRIDLPIFADQRVRTMRCSPSCFSLRVTTEDPVEERSSGITVLATIRGEKGSQVTRVQLSIDDYIIGRQSRDVTLSLMIFSAFELPTSDW